MSEKSRTFILVGKIYLIDNKYNTPQIAGHDLIADELRLALRERGLCCDHHNDGIKCGDHVFGNSRHSVVVVESGGINDLNTVLAESAWIVNNSVFNVCRGLLGFRSDLCYIVCQLFNRDIFGASVLIVDLRTFLRIPAHIVECR